MDKANVEKFCIPAVQMRSYQRKVMIWDISTEEVARITNKYPERFVGLAGINPFKRMEDVREMERAIKDFGFKGAYLHTYGFGIPLDHRWYYPFYAKCVELGVPVMMQVGHSLEHMPSEMGHPIHLDNIALDFPELNLIGAHTGWPWVEEMIALAWKHENVYVGIDAHMPRYLDPSLIQFMKTRGQDKVLWGTNGPIPFSHKMVLDQIEELNLKEEVKRKILRENAVKVFKL